MIRDDRAKWPPALGHERTALSGENVEVRLIQLHRQTVISGAANDCLLLCGLSTMIAGGVDVASGEFYAVRQRRDRLLVVNGSALTEGWHAAQNVAVSDMSAAYAVASLSGSNVEQLIATGTEFAGGAPSPSVSRLWHGFGILLYRHEQPQTYRMHIRIAQLEAVWEMIDHQIIALAGISGMERACRDVVIRGNDAISNCKQVNS